MINILNHCFDGYRKWNDDHLDFSFSILLLTLKNFERNENPDQKYIGWIEKKTMKNSLPMMIYTTANQTKPIQSIFRRMNKKKVVQGRISDRIFIYRSDHRNGKTFLKKQTKFSTKKQKKIELYSFDFVI